MKSNKARTSFGLSLSEILVVMSIVLVLTALLLPAFFRSREAALQTGCTQNLHQIGIALELYRSDNDGSGKYGTPTTMGLPPGFSPEVRMQLRLSKDTWLCPRGSTLHPGVHSAVSYYLYFPLPNDSDEAQRRFEGIAQQYQDSTLLLYYMYHSDAKGVQSPFYPHVGIGLLLGGQTVVKIKAGDWLAPEWWANR